MHEQVIHIQTAAPAKPAYGAACNGCGVCCLAEPCPLGVVLSRRTKGACIALRWDPENTHYRCAAVLGPTDWVERRLAWLPNSVRAPVANVLRRMAVRWISSGSGCDSTLEASKTIASETANEPAPPKLP